MFKKIIPIIIGASAVIIFFASTFCVKENQYGVVKELGKIKYVVSSPGLNFHIPFIQNVEKISKAQLLYDIPKSDVITKDKKSMIADNFVIWQIEDPIKFAQTLNNSKEIAENRINTNVYNSTKNTISNMNQEDIIVARDKVLSNEIIKNMGDSMSSYGIKIVDVEVKVLDLPEANKEAVYTRMISERNNIAATYTAEGESEAQKIKNRADKDANLLLSDANKQAKILEAEGEAEYMKILQESYNDKSKADFYKFIRSLDMIKTSFSKGNKKIILDKDSEIAQLFYN